MSFPVDGESSSDPRTFSPTPPNDTPTSPGPSNSGAAKPLTVPPASGENVPMPQDMTPKESPKNAPGSFDPLGEEAAPAADNVLDPVSYDLPRIPPIPARVRSVVKRSGPSTVRPIATNAQQFQR